MSENILVSAATGVPGQPIRNLMDEGMCCYTVASGELVAKPGALLPLIESCPNHGDYLIETAGEVKISTLSCPTHIGDMFSGAAVHVVTRQPGGAS